MAGERQTEPQADRSLTEIWRGNGAEAAWRTRCLRAEARAENQVAEIVTWLRHYDRFDEIVGAKTPEGHHPLWEAARGIEREFAGPARTHDDTEGKET